MDDKLKEAIRPFYEAVKRKLAEKEKLYREIEETLPADEDSAGDIYDWALDLTYGDIRRLKKAFEESE